MKFCNECKRLSKDDDFCSHCGAAVFGSNNYSASSVSCAGSKGHDHDKLTYDSRLGSYVSLSGKEVPVHIKSDSGSISNDKVKKAAAIIGIILFLISFLIPLFIDFIDEVLSDFF